MSIFNAIDPDDPEPPPLVLMGEVAKHAILSECEKYRYVLSRTWGLEPPLVFVMLNPSTADDRVDDPTIRKCIGFARREKCGGIVVVNLYAWRATSPADMKKAADPIGPDNNRFIYSAVTGPCEKVVVAWGANAEPARARDVLKLIRDAGKEPLCLGKTNSLQPRHPLMLAYATPLEALSERAS